MSQISRLRDAEISNGNLINADDIDAELNQLVTESNGQDTRLTSLESGTMTIGGVKSFAAAPKTDQIDEKTPGTGVTVDGVLLRDGALRVPGSSGYTPAANGALGYDTDAHAYKLMVNDVEQELLHTGNAGLPEGYITGPHPVYASAASWTLKAGYGIRSGDNAHDIRLAGDVSINLATSGAGGLDTGSEASDTWYRVAVIKKSSDGGVSAVFTTATAIATVLSNVGGGYDIGAMTPYYVRNDGSGNLMKGLWSGNLRYPEFTYMAQEADTQIYSGNRTTTWTAQSAAAFVPPNAQLLKLQVRTSSIYYWYGRATGESHDGQRVGNNSNAVTNYIDQSLNGSQSYDAKSTITTSMVESARGFKVTA